MAMMKKRVTTIHDGKKQCYDVLLTIELQGTYTVEASSPEEAEDMLKRRWTDGIGDDAIVVGDLETTNVQLDVQGVSQQ